MTIDATMKGNMTKETSASGAGADVMTTGAGTEIVTLIEVRERGGVIVMTEIVTTLAEVAGIVTGIVTTGGAVVVTEAEAKRKTSPSKLN